MENSTSKTLHIGGVPYEVEVKGANAEKVMEVLEEGLNILEDLMIYRQSIGETASVDANALYDNFLAQYQKADEIPAEEKLDDHNTGDNAN